jgi:hypothetical protein
MSEEPKPMQCAEFQAQLPELIGSGASAAGHPHLKECDLCRELLESLETIAAAARQLFPEVDPPKEVWENIQEEIKKGNG